MRTKSALIGSLVAGAVLTVATVGVASAQTPGGTPSATPPATAPATPGEHPCPHDGTGEQHAMRGQHAPGEMPGRMAARHAQMQGRMAAMHAQQGN